MICNMHVNLMTGTQMAIYNYRNNKSTCMHIQMDRQINDQFRKK